MALETVWCWADAELAGAGLVLIRLLVLWLSNARLGDVAGTINHLAYREMMQVMGAVTLVWAEFTEVEK